jgi:hypothetical protein
VWLLLLLLLLVLLVQLVVLLLLLQMAAEPQHFQFLEGVKSYTKHIAYSTCTVFKCSFLSCWLIV